MFGVHVHEHTCSFTPCAICPSRNLFQPEFVQQLLSYTTMDSRLSKTWIPLLIIINLAVLLIVYQPSQSPYNSFSTRFNYASPALVAQQPNFAAPQAEEVKPQAELHQRTEIESPAVSEPEDESWRKVKVLCFVLTYPKALG